MSIKIISKKDGFRRAGLAHSGTVVYPDDRFSAAELAALKAEPRLDVSETDDPPDSLACKLADEGKPEKKGRR